MQFFGDHRQSRNDIKQSRAEQGTNDVRFDDKTTGLAQYSRRLAVPPAIYHVNVPTTVDRRTVVV
jgi:hypothetical protein